MALLLMEGFDNKIAATLRGWSVNVAAYQTGRISGFAADFSSTPTLVLPSTYATIIAGIAWLCNKRGSVVAREILKLKTASGTTICSVVFNENNASISTISLLDSAGSVVYTSPANFSALTWYQIELKIMVSGGVWELRANGGSLSSGSGASFGSRSVGSLAIGASSSR